MDAHCLDMGISTPPQVPDSRQTGETASHARVLPCKVCGTASPLAFTRTGARRPLLERCFHPEGYVRPYYHCPECGLLFHVGFDDLTPEQEKLIEIPGVRNAKKDVLNRAFREVLMCGNLMHLFNVPASSKILVFGCGAGLSFNLMLQYGWNAYATDLNVQFRQAATIFPEELFQTDLMEQMLLRFRQLNDIRPASLGVVTMTEVFEHLSDPVGMMQRLASLVRPGGIIIGTTGWVDMVREPLRDWWYVHCLSHCTFLSSESFKRICTACDCTGVLLSKSKMLLGDTQISDTQTIFAMQKLPSKHL